MPGKETVVVLVHGANQSGKDAQKNHATWIEALNKDRHSREVLALMQGEHNQRIVDYHETKHPNRSFPIYEGLSTPWYGNVWKDISLEQSSFSRYLNVPFDEDEDDRISLLERVERKGMKNHFDELVPFYELAVRRDNEQSLYESICDRFLDQLIEATANGQKSYVLVGHSMGCAVTYNVMTHISAAAAGQSYCPIDGTLSEGYRNKAAEFAASASQCFGLLTFGNYTGYNWCQRLNHRLLFGSSKEAFVYPDVVARWYNFWTVLGGDPYILDDQQSATMVDDDDGRYDDVVVLRFPFTSIGHGRSKWFGRKNFSKNIRKKMTFHLYD